jgi:hypothetical protein
VRLLRPSRLLSPIISSFSLRLSITRVLIETGLDGAFIPMHTSTPCEALRLGVALELRYDGFSRVVEVHAVGEAATGHRVMRVWQIRGGSASDEPVGWKLMRLDEGFSVHLTNEKSMAPRQGYKRGDKAMKQRIYCQL